MATRKSRLMRRVEERYNRPLEELLPEMYTRIGLPGMAEDMEVNKGTLWYWLLKFGVNVRRVTLAPVAFLFRENRICERSWLSPLG